MHRSVRSLAVYCLLLSTAGGAVRLAKSQEAGFTLPQAGFILPQAGFTLPQAGFTLPQALSAPYAVWLAAAPTGARFAWVENAEGRHNLWVGGPGEAAHALTHYTEDDAQDISGLAWSPDGAAIAFVRGAENGADGKPANPAHLQSHTARELRVAAVNGNDSSVRIDEGQNPLWLPSGKGLFYVRGGQIWLARFADLSPGECVIGSGCYLSAGLVGSSRAPVTLQAVYDRGLASQLTLSPDGSLLAFVSRRDHDHSFIGLFDVQARTLRFVAPSTGSDFAPAFSRDGKYLAWLRAPFTDVTEFAANRVSANPWSIQLADVNGGPARTVFAPEANKPGSVLPHLATGEPRLFWAGEVFPSSHAGPGSIRDKQIPFGNDNKKSPAAGKLVFFSEADGWVHLYSLDPAHLAVPLLLTPGDFEVEDAVVSPDGKTLMYASNQLPPVTAKSARSMATGKFDSSDSERRHLWSVDLTQARPVPQQRTRGTGIETHPQLASDGGTVAALVSDERYPMYPAFVAQDGSLTPLHADAVPAGYPAKQFVAPEQVFFLAADKAYKLHGQLFLPGEDWQGREADPPPTAKDDKEEKVGQGREAGPPPTAKDDKEEKVGQEQKQVLRCAQDDNVETSGVLRRGRGCEAGPPPGAKDDNKEKVGREREAGPPPAAKDDNKEKRKDDKGEKRPAILFFHGGPHREMLLGYPGMEYYSNAYAMNQYLVSKGFIVLSVNYRCGIGYGMEFRQCEHAGADGASEYNDVLGAAAYLRSRPDVNANRIGLWGGSYGGYLTALGLARNSDLFAAGVDFHGVHEWILEDNRADWLRGSNAERDAIAARAHASSPMADVDRWRSPVLLIHGDDDANVAYGQTPVLADALRARGVPMEELIFPDEVHEFLLHRDWLAAYEAEAAFFERTLKPGVAAVSGH